MTEAIAAWNVLGVTHLSVDDPTPTVDAVPLQFRDAAGVFFGLYDAQTGELIINQRVTDPRARTLTIAHELGHAMGLSHVDPKERSSVMNPGNVVQAPTTADGEALLEQWSGCGP